MSQDDKYTYPGSGGVLINKLGLTDGAELDLVMNDFASTGWATLRLETPVVFDFPYLQHVHREMFDPLFTWAGEPRDVDAGAGNTGIVYARPDFVKPGVADMFAALEGDGYLLGVQDADDFAEQLAVHWGYLTIIHPFRDGNTRSQSFFVSSLARAAGHPINWSRLDVDDLRVARLRAAQGSESALAGLLRAAVSGQPSAKASAIPVFRVDTNISSGVAVSIPTDRCGKPRANGRGFCMRRVGENGCPYHA